jgi:hypothetical protein
MRPVPPDGFGLPAMQDRVPLPNDSMMGLLRRQAACQPRANQFQDPSRFVLQRNLALGS